MDIASATTAAGFIGICSSTVNLMWDLPLLSQIYLNTTDGTGMRTFVPTHLGKIHNLHEIFGAGLMYFFFSTLGIIFGFLCIRAKTEDKKHWLHCFWIHSLTRSLFEFMTGYYFFIRCYRVLKVGFPDGKITEGPALDESNSYYILAIFFSGVYFFWPFVNFTFALAVMKRILQYKEARDRKALKEARAKSKATKDEHTPLTGEDKKLSDYIPYSNYKAIEINPEEFLGNEEKSKEKKNVQNIIDSLSKNNALNLRDYENLL